ncbi:MAG TPA: phage holin family protein [Thermoanaerobaculia bacterium]|nr:phage holin family protein [Thermoanaerobaculia bacterium]
MSTERAELPGEDAERDWRDRLAEVAASGRALLATRLEIFRAEASAKAVLAARGLAFVVVAAALGVGALLLGAALVAALFAKLLHSIVLGILAAVLLYALGAGLAAKAAFSALTRVRPTEFPETARELARDWEAASAALAPDVEEDEDGPGGAPAGPVDDLEERFRAGSE